MKICTWFIAFFVSLTGLSNAQTFTGSGGPIPDNGTSIEFEIPVSGLASAIDTQSFGIESVCLNAYHTWNADLSVSLIAPDGSVTILFSSIGGDTDGFENTCLSGNADQSIFSAPYPFTGVFKPLGDMGLVNNGQNPNGVWKLHILDTYAFADEGGLIDWSITFGENPCKPFPFESSDLPIVRINTLGQYIPDDPKIDAIFELIDNGPGQRNYPFQTTTAYSGPIGVELHGNSTQGFPKKSMKIEMRDDDGNDTDVSLLGLAETSDYVLAANFSDKTLMRNALTYDLSRQIGQYAPRTRFCELMLNNTYQGIYILTERIKRGDDLVDISRLDPSDTSGVELTGGYIIKIDWNTTPGWNSQFNQPNSPNIYTYFQYDYPRWDRLAPQQATYIRNYVDSFEVALHGNAFQDVTEGWRRFGNEKSFIDFLIVNELGKNVDGYRLSTYFHKDRDDKGGKITMGPVWDFDLAWYNADYCDAWNTAGWAYNINYVCGDAGVPFWWEKLASDSLFRQHLGCRWADLRTGSLHTDSIFQLIDVMAGSLEEAQERNFTAWPILGIYVWPNPGFLPDTYAGEVQKLKDWTLQRLDWLDGIMASYQPAFDASFAAQTVSGLNIQFTPPYDQPLYQYLWDFGDGAVSNERSPVHTYAAAGNYTVQCTVSTQFGCSATVQQTLAVGSSGTVSVPNGTLQIAPNPATDVLRLSAPGMTGGPVEILIYNALGEKVAEEQHAGMPDRIDIRHLPPGACYLLVRTADRSWSGRFVKN